MVATLTHVGCDVPKETAIPLLLARLMSRVKFTDTGCWEWQGNRNALGYGQANFAGKKYMVHRFMYEALTAAPVPQGFDICHSCHNRACVNPFHIRSDTHQANLMDSSRAKRLNGQAKTHCKRGHPLSGDNLSPGVFRQCKICSRGRYRLRLGWPEKAAFSDIMVPSGYMLDRATQQVVRVRRNGTASGDEASSLVSR
jgi:hypothetical protein